MTSRSWRQEAKSGTGSQARALRKRLNDAATLRRGLIGDKAFRQEQRAKGLPTSYPEPSKV